MLEIDSVLDDYDLLIDSIYEGAIEEVPWSGFLPRFRRMLDAKVISLVLRPPAEDDAGLILNHRRPLPDESDDGDTLAPPDEWPVAAYKEHFFALDPFANLSPNAVVTLDELVPHDQLVDSEYYRQYLEPAGVFYILGADTREADGLHACLRAMRGRDEQPFDDSAKRLFARIVPHLRRAIQIHARLNRIESERDLYAGAVNQLAMGTVILDEAGSVLKTNEPATAIIDAKDGISVKDGRLYFADSETRHAFAAIIDEIRGADSDDPVQVVRALRIRRPGAKADLGAIIRPVPQSQWSEGGSPAIAVFISDPEQQTSTSQETLMQLFGFTRAESALTLMLARGLSLAEGSEELGISQHTARAQLKSVFAKAGVARQAELIRLILKSVATLA